MHLLNVANRGWCTKLHQSSGELSTGQSQSQWRRSRWLGGNCCRHRDVHLWRQLLVRAQQRNKPGRTGHWLKRCSARCADQRRPHNTITKSNQLRVVPLWLHGRTLQTSRFKIVYSITSSTMEIRLGGTVRPSAFAVFKLMTNSNLVDCKTGRSAGLSPLRMRPVYRSEERRVGKECRSR